MALNTSIRGIQIKAAAAADGLQKDGSGNFAIDVSDFAGYGLKDDGSENLDLDLNELNAVAIDVSADEIAIIDATDTSTKKESVADLMTAVAGTGLSASAGVLALNFSELGAVAVDVSADEITIIDATDGSSKKESIADLATAMAGTGLTATNGVLSVDENIVEDDIQLENESSNCDGIETVFNLTSEPVVNSVQVFLNGLLQEEGSGKDYLLNAGAKTVTFTTAPETGDILLIHYIINN